MNMWIIGAAAAAAAAAPLAGATIGRQPAEPGAVAAAAAGFKLGDAAFLAGAWRGKQGGDLLEEQWTGPSGRNMTGMFRWVGADGGARVVELLTLSQEGGDVVLRLRHFDGALTPWKGEAEPVTLKLAEATPSRAVFRSGEGAGEKGVAAIKYDAAAEGRLTVRIEFAAGSGRGPLVLEFERAGREGEKSGEE